MTSKHATGAAAPGISAPIQVSDHPKNSRETYRVLITEFKGRNYIDARVWACPAPGEFKATQKGLTLKFADAEWLHQALGNAIHEAKAQGLTDGGAE